jgi:tetratricopeptide (TPR) repeat protein
MTVMLVYCSSGPQKEKEKVVNADPWLNHNDSVKYVGMQQCMLCHQDKHKTFVHTGMGMSFDEATKQKSSAKFDKHTAIYDKFNDFWYHPFWDGDSLKIKEYRLAGKDTTYQRTEKVDYIIGSGQHTNSHIFNTNGYLHQMPMTFYTQKGEWDLPPGFENGANTRFSRKIGLECMSCHNALPDFVPGSENKFFSVPNGINCERCHGPGSLHVQEKQAGHIVDTSKYADYTIVNPGKLPIDLQFDVCQRCHLQGNAILKDGKSFYDFKPGMKLSDVWTVFLPKYENAEDEFIMASHADRLKMSQCFLQTFKPADSKDSLRPYKSALTCVTCHNPHVSVKETGNDVFNNACKNCHGPTAHKVCTEKEEVRKKVNDNCFSCHMPKSGAIDIPHVRVTDHYIAVHKQQTVDVKKIKKFIGLYAINEKSPSNYVKAKAYLNQYEKFDYQPYLLDSAKRFLPEESENDVRVNFEELVHYYFIKKDHQRILEMTGIIGQQELLLNRLTKKTWDNYDAWVCYRIGEAYMADNKPGEAMKFYTQADKLAPFNPEFKNKLACSMLGMGNNGGAKKIFEGILLEDPKFAPAYCNLGYIYLLDGDVKKGEELINRSLALDPDYDQALINKAQVYLMHNDMAKAKEELKKVLKKDPGNVKAKDALAKLNGV